MEMFAEAQQIICINEHINNMNEHCELIEKYAQILYMG